MAALLKEWSQLFKYVFARIKYGYAHKARAANEVIV